MKESKVFSELPVNLRFQNLLLSGGISNIKFGENNELKIIVPLNKLYGTNVFVC